MLSLSFPRENLEKVRDVMKERRLVLNMTQKDAARRSGVNLQTLRLFEQKGDISFLNLLKLMGLYQMEDRVIRCITDRSWWTLEQLERAEKRKRAR